MVLALFMAFLILTGQVRYGHVLLFAFLYGALNAMDLPVRQSFTVELAGKDRYPGAIALNSFGFNTSRLLGPALAGVLIALFGVGVAYLANALSFLPLLFVLKRVPLGPRGRKGMAAGGGRPRRGCGLSWSIPWCAGWWDWCSSQASWA